VSTTLSGKAHVIPRWVPIVAGVGLLTLLVVVASLRLSGWNPSVAPGSLIVERQLRFADTADGGVAVIDVASGDTVTVMRGEQGFLRGVLRGLARDRRMNAVGAEPPYVLSLHNDGRLVISDPVTGQRIDLASFGPDNAAVFARWLPASAVLGVKKS